MGSVIIGLVVFTLIGYLSSLNQPKRPPVRTSRPVRPYMPDVMREPWPVIPRDVDYSEDYEKPTEKDDIPETKPQQAEVPIQPERAIELTLLKEEPSAMQSPSEQRTQTRDFSELQKGVIWAEVLGRPRALRPFRDSRR